MHDLILFEVESVHYVLLYCKFITYFAIVIRFDASLFVST